MPSYHVNTQIHHIWWIAFRDGPSRLLTSRLSMSTSSCAPDIFCCDQLLDQASLTIRMQCGPLRHRCLQSLSKKTNLIGGQPPNTVDGRPDAAMDTMQLALPQSLRTLLFVIVRVGKNVRYHELSCPMYYFLARCITRTVVAGHNHGFQAAMRGWCPATMWIAHGCKHADQKEHCLSFWFFSGVSTCSTMFPYLTMFWLPRKPFRADPSIQLARALRRQSQALSGTSCCHCCAGL